MRIVSKSLRRANVTALFDQALSFRAREVFDDILGADEAAQATFIDTPALRAMVVPLRHKEIVFGKNRLVVSEVSGDPQNFRDLVQIFSRVLNIVRAFPIKAFGLNFTTGVNLDSLGSKIVFNVRSDTPG